MKKGKTEESPEAEEMALSSLVRQHGSVAIAGLVKTINTCKNDRLRVSAINMLLDLGYGRPPQARDLADRDPPPLPEFRDDMTLEESQAAYKQLRNMPVRF
jgi:hypothetical protein